MKIIPMIEWVNKDPPMSTTTYKAVWTIWLWIWTGSFTLFGGLFMMVAAIYEARHGHEVKIPAGVIDMYGSWLFALVAFSGVTTAEFFGKRKTHLPYVEAQAEAKAKVAATVAANAPTPVNVRSAENVNIESTATRPVAAVVSRDPEEGIEPTP